MCNQTMSGKEERSTNIASVVRSNEEEIGRNFLDDISGTFCSFKQLGGVKTPIVAGKIVAISQSKSNETAWGPTIIVFTLREDIRSESAPSELKIFFVNEAAHIMTRTKLKTEDFLAIRKPKLFRNSSYSLSAAVSPNVRLIVGIPTGNRLKDIYGRKSLTENWCRVFSFNAQLQAAEMKRKLRSTVTDDEEHEIPTANEEIVDNNEQDDEIPSSLDLQYNPRPLTSFNTEGTNLESQRSPANTEVAQLKDIRMNANVTVFGVISSTRKNPVLTASSKYCTKIEITDESNIKFPVKIYTKADEIMPTIRLYDIIKLTNMKTNILNASNQLSGTIKRAKDIVTFSREDPSVIFLQSQSCEYSDEDRRRVEELINWMQIYLPSARLFTQICDIQSTSSNINLSGYVVEKKLFENSSNIVLRFRDGTRTKEYFCSYDLTKDFLFTHAHETLSKDLDCVDIIIVGAENTFRERIEALKIGSMVKFYDVRVKHQSHLCENVPRTVIKLCFKAVLENMKIVCNTEDPIANSSNFQTSKQIQGESKKDGKFQLSERKKITCTNTDETNHVNQACPSDLDEAILEDFYRKASEVQKLPVAVLNQTVYESGKKCTCHENWPVGMKDPFWIRVSCVSQIPVINNMSTDLDILALIKGTCERCGTNIPFFFVSEWVQTENSFLGICSTCKRKGEEMYLRYSMMAELLLRDTSGNVAQAVISGSNAEKFFGCTISELSTSAEAKCRLRSRIEKMNILTLKMEFLKTSERGIVYRILCAA